jgi:GH15 family glucan-1,4-alpha-glucosidase
MTRRIEDYGLIGDTQTAALVGRDGSIDWLCLPRFDSGACFAALVGDRSNGRWKLAPRDTDARITRRYVPGSLVLETTFATSSGRIRILDCMPVRGEAPDVVRVVEGISGAVEMEMDLVVRFDYGSTVPWVRRLDGTLSLVAGPDALELVSSVPVHGEDWATKSAFTVRAGDRATFVLTWHPSIHTLDRRADPVHAIHETVHWWRRWSDRCTGGGKWSEHVVRSLITLKALTYAPTGGIVAAPTTSLPEDPGGARNWDYRYCWLRDATFTLQAFLDAGYDDEAVAWRDWLLRAVAGEPSQLQKPSRAYRQSSSWPTAARCVRRGHGCVAPGASRGDRGGAPVMVCADDPPRLARVRVARDRSRTLGGARVATPFHALEGDVLGRIRPRHTGRRALQARRPGREMARCIRRHPSRDM